MYANKDIIGTRGEMLASSILMTDEVFYVLLLGGKVPSFDLYVEINDNNIPFPMLIQVKTTSQQDRYNSNSIKPQ